MEPRSTFKNCIPIKIFFCCKCNWRTSSVINYFWWTLASTFFQIINTNTRPTASNKTCVYTKTAQRIYSSLTNFVSWQFCNKRCFKPIICQRNRNICFTTTKSCPIIFGLNKTIITFRRQTQHNFTKSNNFSHFISPIFKFWIKNSVIYFFHCKTVYIFTHLFF